MKKIIVYTSIIGKFNKLREIKSPNKDIKYVCFTDQKIKSKTWLIVRSKKLFNNSNLNAKLYKVLPHLFFQCDYSLWVDGSIEIYGNIKNLINSHFNDQIDLVLYKHKVRDCPYCEANIIISSKLANPIVIKSQMKKYYKFGLSLHGGLSQGGVLLRKHTKKMELFNLTWWAEICRYTHRDQLSLDYCIQKTNLSVKYFDLPKLYENNGYFKYYGHTKRLKHIINLYRIFKAEEQNFDLRKILDKFTTSLISKIRKL